MKKINLIVAMILMSVIILGNQALAETMNQDNNGTSSMILTREEYVQSLAEERGITYEEADLLEERETQEYLRNKYGNARALLEILPKGEIVYRQINQPFEVGSSTFKSTIMITLHVKYDRSYYPSQGTCQKFVQILDKGVVATGVGTATFEKSAFSAVITNESTYGNEIYMMLSGNVQHVVSKSSGGAAEAAGFSISNQTTTTLYCRKFITKNYTFYSNWDLN